MIRFIQNNHLLKSKLLLLCLLLFGAPSCGTKQSPQPAPNRAEAANNNQSDQQQDLVRIQALVAKQLQVDPNTIDFDAPLSKQKVPADEVDAVEIIMRTEDEFHIEIKEEDTGGTERLADRLSVRKLAEIVAKKK